MRASWKFEARLENIGKRREKTEELAVFSKHYFERYFLNSGERGSRAILVASLQGWLSEGDDPGGSNRCYAVLCKYTSFVRGTLRRFVALRRAVALHR